MGRCKHQVILINQGLHWCGKQNPSYPDCKNCPEFEEEDINFYISTACNVITEENLVPKIGFWKPDGLYGEFSNWYPCKFEYLGIKFNSSEQALMWRKARLFADEEAERKILSTNDQRYIRQVGRQVKLYNDTIWSHLRYKYMVEILYEKFSQNTDLTKKLLDTKKAELLEASPYDNIWGIGSSNVNNIRGDNLLGKALMEVREKLLLDQAYNKINNLCCLNCNRYKDFFQDYNETNSDKDFCKDTKDMVNSLSLIKEAIDELNTIKKGH